MMAETKKMYRVALETVPGGYVSVPRLYCAEAVVTDKQVRVKYGLLGGFNEQFSRGEAFPTAREAIDQFIVEQATKMAHAQTMVDRHKTLIEQANALKENNA